MQRSLPTAWRHYLLFTETSPTLVIQQRSKTYCLNISRPPIDPATLVDKGNLMTFISRLNHRRASDPERLGPQLYRIPSPKA